MIALPLQIELLEPLLATALEGEPNSATSYPFIPGSLIRGALAVRYMQHHGLSDLAMDETARRLFFNGTTRFLNGYPFNSARARSLPVPLSWRQEKGSEPPTTVYDWSLGRGDELEQPKGLNKPFCHLHQGVIELHEPLRRVTVHTQRDRQMGRAIQDRGAVFRYEALAPGQTFGAAILLADQADLDRIMPHLAGTLLLGGSRSAGYGAVTITMGEADDTWQEMSHSISDIPAGQPFRLTLLSDVLARNQAGQYMAGLDTKDLATRLYVPAISIEDTFQQAGLVGGFNRKWGLPLPQVPVLRAGSVFVLRASETIKADAIARLEQEGLGCRRAEGLGRVVVNWQVKRELMLPKQEPPSLDPSSPPVELAGEGQRLAERMVVRLARRRIDDEITTYLNNLRFQPRGISPNQLARVHVIVRSAQVEGGPKRMLDWLQKLGPKTPARKQLEAARVRGTRLWDWLIARCEDPASVWGELGLRQDELISLGQEPAKLDQNLVAEVSLRLVDGALARAIKEVKSND